MREIIDYISERRFDAAQQLSSAIANCFERLPQFTFMYRTGRVAGTREAIVHANYLLIYRAALKVWGLSASSMPVANIFQLIDDRRQSHDASN